MFFRTIENIRLLTSHVEIELGDGGESASTNDRQEGEVDRRREVLAKEEPRDEHAERRLPALDDVRERHGHLCHAHRRRHVPDCVRNRHLTEKINARISQHPDQSRAIKPWMAMSARLFLK
jgi:hypothetical protein